MMARGVSEAYELAEEINRRAGRQQVDTLDIGGGLPVNFASEASSPTYGEYARLLRETVPGLFDGRYGLVTEFGRSLLAKHGTVVARVEYAKSAGGRPVAVTHAGVQVATRTVYAPQSWPLRIAAYDAKGRPKEGPAVVQDVAGPACFAGDLLAQGQELPLLEQGDYAAALDTGAYYFAHHYAYNSLPRPAVHGFAPDGKGGVAFATVRRAQTVEEIVTESGAAHTDSLITPTPCATTHPGARGRAGCGPAAWARPATTHPRGTITRNPGARELRGPHGSRAPRAPALHQRRAPPARAARRGIPRRDPRGPVRLDRLAGRPPRPRAEP